MNRRIVHIPSDFMVACLPEMEGTLIGDKAVSVVFDNSKIKRFVPDYVATTRFAQGIRQSLAWFDADPARKLIDSEANATWDKLIESYEEGLQAPGTAFSERALMSDPRATSVCRHEAKADQSGFQRLQ